MSHNPYRFSSIHVAFLALAVLTIVATVTAEIDGPGGFSLSRVTIEAGGGSSSGGAFILNGTIGQPDAGEVMTGGAFELRGGFWTGGVEPVETCPADIAPTPNGDDMVSVPDLLAVINAWGACPIPPAACPADIAPAGPPMGDGTVGVPDLLRIINNWGLCP